MNKKHKHFSSTNINPFTANDLNRLYSVSLPDQIAVSEYKHVDGQINIIPLGSMLWYMVSENHHHSRF